MITLDGCTVWWLPLGSNDHVPVTDAVMSYELDGELRLAEPLATGVTVEFEPADDPD